MKPTQPRQFQPIKVTEIELTQPLVSQANLTGYRALQALLRWHNTPIGQVNIPVINGQCTAAAIAEAILQQQQSALLRQILIDQLNPVRSLFLNACQGNILGDCRSLACAEHVAKTHTPTPPHPPSPVPLTTVAICTHDRPADLSRCLAALSRLTYPNLEILVIDNAPSSNASQHIVAQYPQVRYVQEPRPGLNWARNRAIWEAKGELIAYTDDDVTVDANWVTALVQVFQENPDVMAVTGLVVAAELETEAQLWFEQNGGFGKGFQRRWWRFPQGQLHWTGLGTGNLGTGANMAFRRWLFEQIGGFDPALDVGTATQGAGDLELFFRVLKFGHGFVYEPSALVWHYHRRDYAQLRSQLQNNGSVYAYFVRSVLAFPETAPGFLRLGLSWLWSGNLYPWLTSLFYPAAFPSDLRWAQLQGCFIGLTSYFKARRQAEEIRETFGELGEVEQWRGKGVETGDAETCGRQLLTTSRAWRATQTSSAIAVRTVELTDLTALTDVVKVAQTRIFVMQHGLLVGSVDIHNQYQPISLTRLLDTLSQLEALQPNAEEITRSALKDFLQPSTQAHSPASIKIHSTVSASHSSTSPLLCSPTSPHPTPRTPHLSISIIVPTHNRPLDLHRCLTHLIAQQTNRSIEIIVVDNCPASGLTTPVVAEFPQVKLVSESRQGVAYARNAGIAASQGEIIVTVDDDVAMPSYWLEQLLAPLARADVVAVTGNVLPLELETRAQQLFEQYGNGGLGRGFRCFEADSNWFNRSWLHAVPTWELGGTANSAYRASVFRDPQVGLMDEALGPGMPSGVGEDIYLFYKILKAGGKIVYQADAYVWHKHRRDMPALKRQLYSYSKGFVAYQLTTLLRDGDGRALVTLLVFLPLYHLKQICNWLGGKRFYPLSLVLLEIAGNLAGAWSLWRSRRLVQQLGRSVLSIDSVSSSESETLSSETLSYSSIQEVSQ